MKITKHIFLIFPIFLMLLISCKKDEPFDYVPGGEEEILLEITTNRAIYKPGENIEFNVNEVPDDIKIRIRHLGETIYEDVLISNTWTWTPPSEDFKGYMVELYQNVEEGESIVGTVAVDVSSSWTKFPRYGFLSKFGNLSTNEMSSVIENLKDYHINGLQYYDWHNKHHAPLKMNGTLPATNWVDIAGNAVQFETVNHYIQTSKDKGIASMFYNLLFGAWEDYAADGVSNRWMIYNDGNHQDINRHNLPDSWESDILVMNPGNPDWQDYIFQKTQDVYEHLEFDGWHLDQLGNRGTVYDFDGNIVSLYDEFGGFLSQLKTEFPEKNMVLNAVNQYGQEQILGSEVDFAYSEVWSPNEGFVDLADIILENYTLSNGGLNSVLAAYVNYNLANSPGLFNTPGVLMADAVIFAFGGVHLELGEHMLAKEYFPNDNLVVNEELKLKLRDYYDFLVAYQNLLRDGGTFNTPLINSGDGKINLNNWPPIASKVSVVGKSWSDKQVIHLLNFTDAIHLNWRDSDGEQKTPSLKENMLVNMDFTKSVTKVWFASPDADGGSAKEIDFTQEGNKLSFKIPSLKYWSMIVIECS